MPQIFNVLRCFSCKIFQVHQVKKSNKYNCKMCNMKQSVTKVYGEGSGAECRKMVQQLNMIQGENGSIVKHHPKDGQPEERKLEHPVEKLLLPTVQESKWDRYNMEEPDQEIHEADDDPNFTTTWGEFAESASKRRGQRQRHKPYQRKEKTFSSNQRNHPLHQASQDSKSYKPPRTNLQSSENVSYPSDARSSRIVNVDCQGFRPVIKNSTLKTAPSNNMISGLHASNVNSATSAPVFDGNRQKDLVVSSQNKPLNSGVPKSSKWNKYAGVVQEEIREKLETSVKTFETFPGILQPPGDGDDSNPYACSQDSLTHSDVMRKPDLGHSMIQNWSEIQRVKCGVEGFPLTSTGSFDNVERNRSYDVANVRQVVKDRKLTCGGASKWGKYIAKDANESENSEDDLYDLTSEELQEDSNRGLNSRTVTYDNDIKSNLGHTDLHSNTLLQDSQVNYPMRRSGAIFNNNKSVSWQSTTNLAHSDNSVASGLSVEDECVEKTSDRADPFQKSLFCDASDDDLDEMLEL